LRADVLGGDLRLLYLLWLTAVESGAVDAAEPEPLPGLGPMTAALTAFVDFFQLDGDLVEVAAGHPFTTVDMTSGAARQIVSALPEHEKTEWLARLIDGSPNIAAEFRSLVRARLEAGADAPPRRTAGELRMQAKVIREARLRKAAEKEAARLKREAAVAERARHKRLEALRQRGKAIWHEIETEIVRRNPAGYDRARSLLSDLKMIAEQDGTSGDFGRRLNAIRDRHARKVQFIARLREFD
jgi:hypothetical protein